VVFRAREALLADFRLAAANPVTRPQSLATGPLPVSGECRDWCWTTTAQIWRDCIPDLSSPPAGDPALI